MDTFAALYVSLRNAVLGPHDSRVQAAPAHRGVGHFLTNGRYPVNMLQESSDLFDPAAPPAVGTPLASGDNPLLNTGKLLIALAVESDVGSPTVTQWIDGALASLRSLFPFSGPFAGFPLRRDPVSSHDWSDQPVGWPMFPPPALYSANFLLDDAGNYQLLAPAHDWRRSRRIGPAEAADLSSYTLRAWGRRHKQDDMARLREMEPSSDELVGLITGLFFVWGFLPDPQKAAAAGILGELAEYLAEHSYFLVRPAGCFSSRGPATGSVAGEYASQRVFARILGDPHAARHDVPAVLASAGLWPSLEADWNTDIVLGFAVVVPLLLAAIEQLFGLLGSLGLGAVDGAASDFLTFLIANGLNPVTAGGAWSLWRGNQLMFDCETRIADDGGTVNEEYPQEIALGTLLNGVSAAARLQYYMGDWGATSTKGWAVGFLPFLGLTALDDSDTLVRDTYLSMYRARTNANRGWAPWLYNKAPRASFPTAVALLLAADADPTAPEVHELEAALVTELTSLHQYFDGLGEQPMTTGPMTEDANPALDYLVAVALAWLHRKRQGGRGVTVTAPGFPQPPTQVMFYFPGDQNWWLGTVGGNGQLTWQPAGNTAAFGNLADGRPLHSGDFAGNGTASMLFFHRGDGWFHGTMVNGHLAWTNVGNTKTNYADTSVWQHHVGSFTAPGRDQVMIYSLTGTQLATLNGTALSWETVDGASDYGDLARMSPRWYADFTGTGKASVLFHAPEDGRWWLGTVAGDLGHARMEWNLVGEGVPMIPQGPG